MRMTTPKDIGQYIKTLRKGLKLNQSDLAKKVGKDQRFISQLESNPDRVALGTIMAVLNALHARMDFQSNTTSNTSHVTSASEETTVVRKSSNTQAGTQYRSDGISIVRHKSSSGDTKKRKPVIVSAHKPKA